MANITINLDVETFIDSEITAAVAAHNLAYNHSHIATVYGWGNHALYGYELQANKGAAGGYASLEAGTGKIPIAQLPDSIIGQVEYKGVWNANTNTPDLSGAGALQLKGNYYICSVGGTQFGLDFQVGDWAIFSADGVNPDKVDNTDAVTSVNTQVGAVVLTTSHINEGTNLYYTDARVQTYGDANYQPLNTNLNSLSGLAYVSASFVKMTGANTFSLDTNTYLTAEADTLATVTGRGATTATACTFSTSLTTPLLIGGIETTSDLVLQTTSGVGATGADMHFLVGNNGATEAMTILNNGNVGIGTVSPTAPLSIYKANTGNVDPLIDLTSTGTQLYNWSFSSMITNMSGSWNNFFFLGKAKSIKNSGYFSYLHYADGSENNCVSVGLFGVDNVLNVTGGANVGIGTISPTAYLHIKAGTATAGTAPLKLTAGTNLTTPEAGAIEFDGTNLYFTDSGGTRRTIAVV